MDVDINAVTIKPPYLSYEEREKLCKDNKCFHCKKPGHSWQKCFSLIKAAGRKPPQK